MIPLGSTDRSAGRGTHKRLTVAPRPTVVPRPTVAPRPTVVPLLQMPRHHLPARVQNAVQGPMSLLIKGALCTKGVLPPDTPEYSIAFSGTDGYQILYGIMRSHHPLLSTYNMTTSIPRQGVHEW